MTDISQRPTTVLFGTDVILGRRKSRAYSIVPDSRESEAFRRQSFKYQFPNPALEAEKRDIDLSAVNEWDVRRHIYGKPLREMTFIGADSTIRRPTVSSARRSVLWSRDRRLYEDNHRQAAEEFKDKPYMNHEYPSIQKHYPGTWKLASREQIQATTERLSSVPAPTAASLHMHKFQCFFHNVLELERDRELKPILQRPRPRTSINLDTYRT